MDLHRRRFFSQFRAQRATSARNGRCTIVRPSWRAFAFVIACLIGFPPAAYALDASVLKQLVTEDSDAKLEAVNKIVTAGDAAAIPIFKAMLDDALYLFNGRLVIVADGNAKDALTGEAVDAPPDKLEADRYQQSYSWRARRRHRRAQACFAGPRRATRGSQGRRQ